MIFKYLRSIIYRKQLNDNRPAPNFKSNIEFNLVQSCRQLKNICNLSLKHK